MGYRYPIDICTSQNKKQTYSVESHLSVAKTEDAQSPLKLYNSTFSLYKHAIIESESVVKSVWANMNVREMQDLFLRTDYAFHKSMDYECAPVVSAEGSSPAYTVKITSGVLKGKTPAEVLIETKNVDALNNQYAWLKNNLQEYPKNQIQMDAILDAAKLYKEGKLEAAATSVTPRIRLYPAGQPTPKPLRRKPRQDGKCFVYEMEIFWNVGDDYPVEIIIRNYWAPVIVKEDGTIRVVQKEAEDKEERTMRLGEADWLNHIRAIQDDMDSFKMLHARETWADAKKTLFENRLAK